MPSLDVFSEEFAQAVANAGLRARRDALASGHAVVFVDDSGRYRVETPDGRQRQVYLRPGAPRESHLQVIDEVDSPAS